MRRFVHYYPDAMGDSGVTAALWGWTAALSAAGQEVVVLHAGTGSIPTPEPFVVRPADVRQELVPHRGKHRASRHPVGLEKRLRTDDVLILHEGWVTANVVAARAARRAGVPYLVVPHGVYDPLWRHYLRSPVRLREALERQVLAGAAAVHVFFGIEAAAVSALAPAASYIVVPTGREIPADRWSGGGGGYLAWVGRYDPTHKGLDLLVDALALIPPERRPLIRLRGYDYQGGVADLRAIRDRHGGMAKWMDIGGPISGDVKRRFLLEADGYVLPSRWESYGVALLEALSLGVPCLVSSSVSVSSLLASNEAAVLRPPDPHSMSSGLQQLQLVGGRIGPRGRETVERCFDWPTKVKEFLTQVEEVVGEGNDTFMDR